MVCGEVGMVLEVRVIMGMSVENLFLENGNFEGGVMFFFSFYLFVIWCMLVVFLLVGDLVIIIKFCI